MSDAATPLSDASEAFALLAAWERQGTDQVARAQAVAAAVQSVRVVQWSPGREVSVTLDHAGLLVDLEVTERALATSPLALSRIVTATAAAALRRLPDEQQSAVTAVVGEDDALGSSAVAHVRAVVDVATRSAEDA
jgi:hypothetical protein